MRCEFLVLLAVVAFSGSVAAQPAADEAAAQAKALVGRWKSEVKDTQYVMLTVKDGKVHGDWREGANSRTYQTTLADFLAKGGFTRDGAVTVAYKLNGDKLTLDAKDKAIRGEWVLTSYLTWALDGQEATYQGKPLAYWAGRLPGADPAERVGIFEAVRALGDDARPMIPALGAVLKSKQKGAREGALERLAAFGPAAKSTAPEVLALVGDENDFIRMLAVHAAGKIDADARDAVPVLVKALGDPTPHVRREAASALSNFVAEAEAVVPALAKLLSDPQPEPRRAAVSALAAFGVKAKSTASAVAKLLESSLDGGLRSEAIRTLLAIRADPTVAVPALATALKDRRPDVAAQAADALRDYGPAAAASTDALSAAIQDGRERRAELRKRAEAALRAIDRDAAARAVAERKTPWQRDAAVTKQIQALQGVWKSEPKDGETFILEARGEEVLLRWESGRFMTNGTPKLMLEDLVMDGGLSFFRGASVAEVSCRLQDGKLVVASESRGVEGVWVLSR